MSEKTARILYWVVTIPLAAMMLFAAFNYTVNHELIVDVFKHLGFPTYIIYPLAAAKLLGIVAIVSSYSKTLKEWAYAGFFFNFLLAFSAHLNAGDFQWQWVPALVCLILLVASYVLDKRINGGVLAHGH